MSDLRTQVIRLAHQNPELRPVLLPLLREAGWGNPRVASVKDMAAEYVFTQWLGKPVAKNLVAAFQKICEAEGDEDLAKLARNWSPGDVASKLSKAMWDAQSRANKDKWVKLLDVKPNWEPSIKVAGCEKKAEEGKGKTAMEFKSKEALETYLKAHPKADRNKHKVKQEYYHERDPKEVAKEVNALDTKKKVLDHVKTLEPKHQKRFHEVLDQIKDLYKNDEHSAYKGALHQVKGEANLKPRDVER